MKDLRNELNVELPRAKGDYLEKAPSFIWTEPGWVLEEKIDDVRMSLQIGAESSISVGRNRQDFLKGIDKAGPFRCLNHLNPNLQALANTGLEGTVLDGGLTEVFKQNGEYDKGTEDRVANRDFVGYTVWTCLFDNGLDVRGLSERYRRMLAGIAVQALNNPRVRLIGQVPATKENLQKHFFDVGKEGAIAKKQDLPIPKQQRANPYWWKLKGSATTTVIAFVVGVSEAKEGGSGVKGIDPKPNRKAATFTMAMMDKNGNQIEVGKMSNLPEDAVKMGWKRFDLYRNRTAEMQVSGWDGARFRFPRFVEWRQGMTPLACSFETQKKGGR